MNVVLDEAIEIRQGNKVEKRNLGTIVIRG
jgi:small nuclear ribonucleoprotein (snRNP)-like protein